MISIACHIKVLYEPKWHWVSWNAGIDFFYVLDNNIRQCSALPETEEAFRVKKALLKIEVSHFTLLTQIGWHSQFCSSKVNNLDFDHTNHWLQWKISHYSIK